MVRFCLWIIPFRKSSNSIDAGEQPEFINPLRCMQLSTPTPAEDKAKLSKKRTDPEFSKSAC
jgi:hypothetical protein